jgi:hypothetical protein
METQEEIEWIKSLGFDDYRDIGFGNFLIANRKISEELINTCKEKNVKVKDVFSGLFNIKNFIKSTDDLREYCLTIIDLVRAYKGEDVRIIFWYGLNCIRSWIKSIDDFRVLVDLVRACKGKNIDSVFSALSDRKIPIESIDDFRDYGLILIDLAKISGNHFKVFYKYKGFFLWYVNEVRSGKKFSLKELLIIFNKSKFPGFSDDFYAKLDPRISKFNNAKKVNYLLNRAKYGRRDFYQWYANFNVKRLKNLANYGINLNYWLGIKEVKFKDKIIEVRTDEQKDIINRELPKLKQWFNYLLETVNDKNFVLAQIFARVEKANDLENLFIYLRENPANIPPFIRNIIFSIVKEKADLSSIPEKELRKLVNTFYGRELAKIRAWAKDVYKTVLQSSAFHELESEFEFVRTINYEQLIKDLPHLRVNPYLQTRLGEFAKACPKTGKESDLTIAIHELERVAQAVENVLAEQSEKDKISFKAKYNVNFRVSDKFPLEVLTIGADSHACIRPGGTHEYIGFNFFQDSDALLIEILSKKTLKKPKRIGMVLAFACFDDKKRPVLGLNTVEIAKSWPDDAKAEFFDTATKWLIDFAKNAGFKAIMIGQGYGSKYFREKYGEQQIWFRKINPFPTLEYNSNTFEHGMQNQTPEGIILVYAGLGTIIWEE